MKLTFVVLTIFCIGITFAQHVFNTLTTLEITEFNHSIPWCNTENNSYLDVTTSHQEVLDFLLYINVQNEKTLALNVALRFKETASASIITNRFSVFKLCI